MSTLRNTTGVTLALLVAALITLALFALMAFMIETASSGVEARKTRKLADIVMPDREIDTRYTRQKPDKPEPEKTPPQLPQISLQQPQPTAAMEQFQAPKISHQEGPSLDLSASEGDYLPIVKVQPIYPRRALQRGISGYVVLEFTVTKTGAVRDVVVVEEEPAHMFSRAAIKAAERFKYKPRIVDGVAADVLGVRNKIVFAIEE